MEDLLSERGIDIRHEAVRFWWNGSGPMFAAEIRQKQACCMRLRSGRSLGLSKAIRTAVRPLPRSFANELR